MSEISTGLEFVRKRIAEACARSGRDASAVSLIAVSKTVSPDLIREAAGAGQLIFGESKLQEAEAKIPLLPANLSWHFIGRLQRNKVRKVLALFDVIHSIDSLRLATSANEVARELGIFPKVFLQVNVAGEASKGGFDPDGLSGEIEQLLALDRLEICGLMCIPPAEDDASFARPWFVRLRELRDSLEKRFGASLPCLSMGMSGDYEIALEEGATHVRVGSAIFGQRTYRVDGELG